MCSCQKVVPSSFEENLDKGLFSRAAAYAQETALQKAKEVASRAWPQDQIPDLVIGADTVVDLEGTILEKPMDAADADAMLSRLSGRRHTVHTGVALILPSSRGTLQRPGHSSSSFASYFPRCAVIPGFYHMFFMQERMVNPAYDHSPQQLLLILMHWVHQRSGPTSAQACLCFFHASCNLVDFDERTLLSS